MTPATIVEWASATKAVTSCAVALLWESAAFDLDDPVCRYVPEFAARAKQGITVRHLLTHTAGLTDPVDRVMPFEVAVAAVCAAPLVDGWTPGRRPRTARPACGSWRSWSRAAQVGHLVPSSARRSSNLWAWSIAGSACQTSTSTTPAATASR